MYRFEEGHDNDEHDLQKQREVHVQQRRGNFLKVNFSNDFVRIYFKRH